MGEIINIHIGQAGIQTGSAIWEQICAEHEISLDGQKQGDQFSKIMFNEVKDGRYVPRAIFADLENSVIDSVKNSQQKQIFNQENLLCGKEDAANNFIKAKYTIGKELIDQILDQTRKELEKSDQCSGFIMTHSIGGGTGSGLGDLFYERASVLFGKRLMKLNFSILPSQKMSSSVVEPLNAVQCLHSLIEFSDLVFCFDNYSLYNICAQNLQIENPNYTDINRIIAQVYSGVTSNSRFQQAIDLTQLGTNLVPYPRIHFVSNSLSPLMNHEMRDSLSSEEILENVFEKQNSTLSIDLNEGLYIASDFVFRGNFSISDLKQNLFEVEDFLSLQAKNKKYKGTKCSLIRNTPKQLPNSIIAQTSKQICATFNSTSIQKVFKNITWQFDRMYAKRAFVHWYVGEGLSEGFFTENRENLACLEKDYEEI